MALSAFHATFESSCASLSLCLPKSGEKIARSISLNSSAVPVAFRLEVFKMLKKEGKISDTVIDNMLSWHNSGFNIFCSRPTDPNDQSGLERLAQYIIRAPGMEGPCQAPRQPSFSVISLNKFVGHIDDGSTWYSRVG